MFHSLPGHFWFEFAVLVLIYKYLKIFGYDYLTSLYRTAGQYSVTGMEGRTSDGRILMVAFLDMVNKIELWFHYTQLRM